MSLYYLNRCFLLSIPSSEGYQGAVGKVWNVTGPKEAWQQNSHVKREINLAGPWIKHGNKSPLFTLRKGSRIGSLFFFSGQHLETSNNRNQAKEYLGKMKTAVS